MIQKIQLSILMLLCPLLLTAKDSLSYASPFDFPLLLSANFGELRPNHFHNGLDIKTKGSVGHPIKCIADGYVIRAKVQHGGYGQAIYVAHPNGQTSVYGHIIRFAPEVEKRIRNYQYKNESFVCDLNFTPEEFPVKQGDIIAWSGNEGSSGGPHLHLEIRKTATDEYLNPMPYYKKWLKDTKAPVASHLAVYPVPGEGVVENSSKKKLIPVNAAGRPVTAWGKVYAGISAKDLMDNTSNIYGVYSVTLYVDTIKVFQSLTNAVLPNENRMINSFVDFDERVRTRRWIMRSYKAPGNDLRLLHVGENRGIVNINEERNYRFRYVLEDNFGNCRTYRFTVRGKKQVIPKVSVDDNCEWLRMSSYSFIQRPGLEFMVRKGYVYEDVPLCVKVENDSLGISNRYTLEAGNTPVHGYCSLALAMKRMPVADTAKYYICQTYKNWKSPVAGQVEGRWIRGEVRSFGTFAVKLDTVPPVVTPLNMNSWRSTHNIRFRVKDNESGIDTYKVYVDGKFVLFGLKKGLLIIQDKAKIKHGVSHHLEVVVTDCCGNVTKKQIKF